MIFMEQLLSSFVCILLLARFCILFAYSEWWFQHPRVANILYL